MGIGEKVTGLSMVRSIIMGRKGLMLGMEKGIRGMG